MGVARAPVAGSGCAPACSESVSKCGVLGLVIAQSRQGRRLGFEGRAIWYRIGQRVAQRQRHMGNAHGQLTQASRTARRASRRFRTTWPRHAASLHCRRRSKSQISETNMQRKASARWQGTGKEGSGSLSTQSGTLKDTPYSFVARFGDGKGTNPEELIAAAHAGCFTMALSFMLNGAGFTAEALDTEAALTMEQVGGAWTVTAVHLTTRGRVPDIDAAKFAEVAADAKANCPISRLLNATITMDAKLAG